MRRPRCFGWSRGGGGCPGCPGRPAGWCRRRGRQSRGWSWPGRRWSRTECPGWGCRPAGCSSLRPPAGRHRSCSRSICRQTFLDANWISAIASIDSLVLYHINSSLFVSKILATLATPPVCGKCQWTESGCNGECKVSISQYRPELDIVCRVGGHVAVQLHAGVDLDGVQQVGLAAARRGVWHVTWERAGEIGLTFYIQVETLAVVFTNLVGGSTGIFASILPLDFLNDFHIEEGDVCLLVITWMARLLPEIIIPLSLSWNTRRLWKLQRCKQWKIFVGKENRWDTSVSK